MSFKALNRYLLARIQQEREVRTYRDLVAEYIANIGSLGHPEVRISYVQERQKIYGDYVEDKRSAKEIVEDVFKKHNLTLKEEDSDK